MNSRYFSKGRPDKQAQRQTIRIRRPSWGWRQVLILGLIGALLPGCTVTPTQVLIPLAYAGIGTGIALLVSPSLTAAIVGFVLGGGIGAAIYNNSLKADLMERQGWEKGLQRGK